MGLTSLLACPTASVKPSEALPPLTIPRRSDSMHSLYQALLTQHSRQLTPVRCAEQTIAQLHRYFEDVVLENNLAALIIESLPMKVERSLRDLARVRAVGRDAHKAFFFVSPGDALNDL